MRILLAEDERELAAWLVRAPAQSSFQVDWVDDGRILRRSLKATRNVSYQGACEQAVPARPRHSVTGLDSPFSRPSTTLCRAGWTQARARAESWLQQSPPSGGQELAGQAIKERGGCARLLPVQWYVQRRFRHELDERAVL